MLAISRRPRVPGDHAGVDRRQGLHGVLADHDHACRSPSTRRSSTRTTSGRPIPNVLIAANYPVLARDALAAKLGIGLDDKPQLGKLKGFLSDGVRTQLRDMVIADPAVIGTTRDVDVLVDRQYRLGLQGPDRPQASPKPSARFPTSRSTWMNKLAVRRRAGAAFQHRPVHLRRVEPAGNVGHGRRHHRLVLHDGDRAAAGAADRRRRLDLSRGIRQEDRGSPTSSRSTSTIWRPCRRSCSACSALRCSSTSSACRVRRPWSAAWCCR